MALRAHIKDIARFEKQILIEEDAQRRALLGRLLAAERERVEQLQGECWAWFRRDRRRSSSQGAGLCAPDGRRLHGLRWNSVPR